jgi:hypothetical protein
MVSYGTRKAPGVSQSEEEGSWQGKAWRGRGRRKERNRREEEDEQEDEMEMGRGIRIKRNKIKRDNVVQLDDPDGTV